MRKLSPEAQNCPEPQWLEVADGVRFKVKPVRPTVVMQVGRGARNAAVVAGAEPAEAAVAFTMGIARWAVLEWEGIGDDDGKPLELTPDRLEALLAQEWDLYDEFDRKYVWPVLAIDQEKNGSSVSRTGTSVKAAKTSASTVQAGAKRAPTKKTPAKRTKAASSGT